MVEEQVCTQTQIVDRADRQIEIISDLDRFNSIGGEWDGLVKRAGADRVFLSHTWLRTWWESFGAGRQLHIATVRAGGELIAAAPMMRTRVSMYGFKVARIESIYNPHTPRYDFIVEKPCEEIYRAIWDELSGVDDCDMVLLSQIVETSPTLGAIEKLATADGWLTGRWSAPVSPFIRLECGYEEFLTRLKGGYRYNLRKRYERLSKLGPIDVEVITEKSAVREAMRDGLRIEAAAWKGDQGTAIISDSAVTEFYTRLAEREATEGRLRLSFLRVGGKRISFSYILASEKTLYGVKIGYDPEYHTYSPGNMLLNLILQEACADGMAEYDFLGVDDDWKFDWTKETRQHTWLFLFRNRLRARWLHRLKFDLVPKIKHRIGDLKR